MLMCMAPAVGATAPAKTATASTIETIRVMPALLVVGDHPVVRR
jgi:hypothetical protein